MKKEDVLKILSEDERFKAVLTQTKDEKEREAIKAYTESFVTVVYKNLYAHLEKAHKEDPESLKKALLEIQESLIKGEDGKKTGQEAG